MFIRNSEYEDIKSKIIRARTCIACAYCIVYDRVIGAGTRNRHDLQKAGSVEPLHIICIEKRR